MCSVRMKCSECYQTPSLDGRIPVHKQQTASRWRGCAPMQQGGRMPLHLLPYFKTSEEMDEGHSLRPSSTSARSAKAQDTSLPNGASLIVYENESSKCELLPIACCQRGTKYEKLPSHRVGISSRAES
nr:hypothetical protein CFP56_11195 [Quercus suber]